MRDAVAQLLDAATEGIPWSRREARFARRRPWVLLQECSRLTDMERLTEAQKKAVSDFLCGARIDILLLRGLRSRRRLSRCRAASLLPLVPTRGARVALIDALEKERSRSVKLFMAAALTDLHESFAIPTMIDTLAGSRSATSEACGACSPSSETTWPRSSPSSPCGGKKRSSSC